MKTMLFSVIWIVFIYQTCETRIIEKQSEPLIVKPPTADSISFQAQIQPILEKRCSPCHFTGGKMYLKMPFDSAKTILSHEGGILKRIKDEQENALIKSFIQSNSN